MEGAKRLQFTTVGPPGKPDKKISTQKTHRFELDITESTDTTCPEFFYTELLKTLPGREEKPKSADPFGHHDNADALAAIARAFEEKYNKPDDRKKKKKHKWQDNYYLEQLGEGYDENDTFIDNSEAYDEKLPETMTTKLGGFYINSGRLELKEMSDSSEDEFRSPVSMKRNKKRRISSDDDSDGEAILKKKKIKDTLSVDGEVKKKKKKKFIVPPGEIPFRKPKLNKDQNKDVKSTADITLKKITSPNLNGENGVENGVVSSDSDGSDEVKGHVKSNISMVIDSVAAMATNDSDSPGEFEESVQKKEVDPDSIPKLPASLPARMDEKIVHLKNLAKVSRDGKLKFFTENVNKLLLELEIASKQMSVSNRSAMFAHLAAYLPCSKDTLMKRARTLRVKELEDKIKDPLDKLRQAVSRLMPALVETYEEECKKAAQERLEEGNKEVNKDEKEGGKEDVATESEDDEKNNMSDSVKKRQTGQRKKFVWDSEVRGLLCDVVRVKMHTFMMSKGKSQTAEEFCKAFLEQYVRPIWPKGWMQSRVLYKESRTAHLLYTNPQKPKKTILMSKAASATTQISKTPITLVSSTQKTLVSSAPNLGKVPYVSASKMNSGSNNVKTTSVALNRPVISSPNTPNVSPKKVVPTILDYTNTTVGSVLPNSVTLLNSSSQGGTNTPSPSTIKISDTKVPGTSAKATESSWDHMVSDILRSSISDQPSVKSQPKPMLQKQSSNPQTVSQQAASGFMAQFAKYLHSKDSVAPNQISSSQPGADNQLMLSEHKLLQQQKQQIEAEKQRQIKLLNEQHIQLQEKQKQFQTQQFAKQLVSSQKAGFGQKQKAHCNDQLRMPGQSPMSMAMSKNIPVGHSVSTKPSLGQYQQGSGQQKHLSDNLIRQQLNENSLSSPVLHQIKTAHQHVPNQARYMHPSSTIDTFRKTSPQSQTVKVAHSSSQGKTGSPHVVTLHSSQSKGQVLFNQPNVTVTTNSQQASTLLKSLFGQAQTSSQNYPTVSIQRSSNQGSPIVGGTPPLSQAQRQWSPNSSIQELQARLQSAAGMSTKQYTRPVTSPQPVTGYQSVKLSGLTPEQIQQTYQAAQQLRSPTYGKQMSTPGSHTSDLHQYNSLQQYSYHGYQDSSK